MCFVTDSGVRLKNPSNGSAFLDVSQAEGLRSGTAASAGLADRSESFGIPTALARLVYHGGRRLPT